VSNEAAEWLRRGKTKGADMVDKDRGTSAPGKTSGRMDFKKLTISRSGTTASTREYELLRTASGIEGALYDGTWNFDKLVSRRQCRVAHSKFGEAYYEELAVKFYELGVPGWDGQSFSNPDVLDGEMVSIDIELEGGGSIRAFCSNAYPENYWDFMKLVEEAVYGPKEY